MTEKVLLLATLMVLAYAYFSKRAFAKFGQNESGGTDAASEQEKPASDGFAPGKVN